MSDYLVIGVPQFIGEIIDGRNEIDQIRQSGFIENIGATYIEVQPDYETYADRVLAVNISLAQIIAEHPHHFPIVLAGDCVSSLGMVKGLNSRSETGIIWYDAHGDFNTPETSPSGFLGGMPLAALVGSGNQHLLAALELNPLPENYVIFTDGRDLDPQEGENLRASEIALYEDVNDLLTALLPKHPVYIHLDVDILDPLHMPSLGYPAPNGPDPTTVAETLARIGQEAQVIGLLVSMWNGDKDANDLPLQSTLTMMNGLLANLK